MRDYCAIHKKWKDHCDCPKPRSDDSHVDRLVMCPFCSSKDGYMTKRVASMHTYFTWNGEPDNTEIITMHGGTKKYCASCGKVIMAV